MKSLQFLTDATLTSEDLGNIKGGKRFLARTANDTVGAKLATAKPVLYNGKVYKVVLDASGKAAMVSCDTLDTCVEW